MGDTTVVATAGAIGVFDSGVGGLSVAAEIMRQHPGQPIIYLADQAHTPYGQRSLVEIRVLAEGISRFLLGRGARVIVIACNTASAAALHWLRRQLPEARFVGMEPAVKPAAERTRTGHVGVIATAATFQGELFASLLDRFAGRVAVHTQVCPELVPLVEAGELDGAATRAALQAYLVPLLAAGIDELVLGCTHYPFLRPAIEQIAGPGVEIIDPAPAVARQVGRMLLQDGLSAPAPGRPVQHSWFTTGDPARFGAALMHLLGLAPVGVARAHWDEDGCLRAG